MNKKTPTYQQTSHTNLPQQEEDIWTVQIGSYTVSYKEDASSLDFYFSPLEKTQFQELLAMAQKHPKKIYTQALDLQKKHPNVPQLDNLITFLHVHNGHIHLAEKAIEDSYLRHPHYFFSKINYADQCLRKGKSSEILLIFPSLDLNLLFPDKHVFHFCEFRGFMTLVSAYYLAIGDIPSAKKHLELARLVDPFHPSVLRLQKKIFPKRLLKTLLDKIAGLVRIS